MKDSNGDAPDGTVQSILFTVSDAWPECIKLISHITDKFTPCELRSAYRSTGEIGEVLWRYSAWVYGTVCL